MPTFAQIQEEITNMLAIPDAQLTDRQKAAMDAYLDELGSQEASKVDAFAQFLRMEAACLEACKDESRRLFEKARTIENRIKYLKGLFAATMAENGLKKVSGNAYSLGLRSYESVDVSDISLIEKDHRFTRTTTIVEADKKAIKDALKAGQKVPGCSLKKTLSLVVR